MDPSPGDWTCPGCGDLQFARNAVCRLCKTPNPARAGMQPGTQPALSDTNVYVYGFSPEWGDAELQALFVNFGMIVSSKVARHETGASKGFGFVAFSDPASAQLACETLNGQDGGDGKTLQVRPKAGAGGGAAAQQVTADGAIQGDWMCPGCNDHQFARNAQCRKCGTPKPLASMANAMQGDWSCPGCNDHQFARNAQCRKCGTPKPGASIGSMGGGKGMMGGGQGMTQGNWGGQSLYNQPVANQSQSAGQLPEGWTSFLTPDGKTCYMHMATMSTSYEWPGQPEELPEGWMEFVTPDGKTCYTHLYTKATTWERPTAPVASGQGMMASQGQGMMAPQAQAVQAPGDWSCPQCGDHQFARNAKCRKCGTPNPSGGGYDNQANIYVYGIPPEWGNDEMAALFARCGTVVSVKIGTHDDGRSKGYGFVAFDTSEAAAVAVQSFQGFDIGNGKPIQVRIKGDKSPINAMSNARVSPY